jgi:hypothetical protein
MTRVLDRGLGIRKAWGPGIFGLAPAGSALVWLAFYAVAWALIEGLAYRMGVPPQPKLVSLLAWGGCYAAAAIYLAQAATEAVFDTVSREILPHASPAYCASVARDLERRYPPLFLTFVPLALGAASLVAAFWAIDQDAGPGRIPLRAPELWLWAATFLYYFVCAARAVIAARFYLSFACCLERERSSFYVMAASETPLIKGLARLGGLLLGFWAMIFLGVLSIMLLAVIPLGDYAFRGSSKLLFTLIPIAGFFSLGFGSLVYLTSESQIRGVLRRFTSDQAGILQRAANGLLDPLAGRLGPDPAELERIADWHDRIVAGGLYGSRVRVGLSIVLPLLLPVVSLIQTAFGWLFR